MQQNWSIRSRAHECALTGRPFEDGESFHTAIYFDPDENGYVRRDVCAEAWSQELEQRQPLAAWRTLYQKVIAEAKPEIAPKESAQDLLQRFIEEGDPKTEDARYILALMLERKRLLAQTAEKEVDGHKMLFYENKKTGEIFIVRDPELKLDELAQMQDEVATLLAFGGPAANAAKAVGVTLTPEGVVPAPDSPSASEPVSSPEPEANAEPEEDTPATGSKPVPADEVEDTDEADNSSEEPLSESETPFEPEGAVDASPEAEAEIRPESETAELDETEAEPATETAEAGETAPGN